MNEGIKSTFLCEVARFLHKDRRNWLKSPEHARALAWLDKGQLPAARSAFVDYLNRVNAEKRNSTT